MTGNEPQITEADLLSYVDGQLEDDRLNAVRAHLTSNPADARKVKMWQQQNATLTALYRPLDTNVVPDRLDVFRIERRMRSERADWRNRAAAAVIVFAIGLTGGWLGRRLVSDVAEPASIVADAAQAHKLAYRPRCARHRCLAVSISPQPSFAGTGARLDRGTRTQTGDLDPHAHSARL